MERAAKGVSNDGRASGRADRPATGSPAGLAGRPATGHARILPGVSAEFAPESPCEAPPGGAILRGPPAPGSAVAASGGPPEEPLERTAAGLQSAPNEPTPRFPRARAPGHPLPIDHPTRSHRSDPSMDAKQVWRAALGELQVALSPANFETWLRDTQLVDVDDNRFRIAVPNGFAKDWLDTRYRSLISQTLARIVGYSVQVEFVVRSAPPEAARRRARPRHAGRARPSRERPSRSGSSRPGSAARAARRTSTRATPSPTSSSARPTAWPTPPACRSPSVPATPTTRSSCTAGSASARPT